MADLVCVAFDDPTTADRALTELTALQKEYVIELKDACVVVRSPDGEVHLHQAMPLVRSGALAGGTSGALWGTLIGLLFLNPLAGMALGAGVGAASGALAGKLSDYGIPDDFIRQLGSTIKPNSSALFLLVQKVTADKFYRGWRSSKAACSRRRSRRNGKSVCARRSATRGRVRPDRRRCHRCSPTSCGGSRPAATAAAARSMRIESDERRQPRQARCDQDRRRAAHMRPESQVQASDRRCAPPQGLVWAVGGMPHTADRRMIAVQEPASGKCRFIRPWRPSLFSSVSRLKREFTASGLGPSSSLQLASAARHAFQLTKGRPRSSFSGANRPIWGISGELAACVRQGSHRSGMRFVLAAQSGYEDRETSEVMATRKISRIFRRFTLLSVVVLGFCGPASAQDYDIEVPGLDPVTRAATEGATLFQNVRVFDGNGPDLSPPSNLLVRGNTIERISVDPIDVGDNVRTIAGSGRVLMPGLIDAHWHAFMAATPQPVLMSAEPSYLHHRAAQEAEATLMRGFTTIRDLGGPVFGLKRAIDEGIVVGPRIYPSGAFISQTSGHGDFRFLFELPRQPGGPLSYTEREGIAAIADSPDEVRLRVREQLRNGASQIKLMAGGGVSSQHNPIESSQFTEAELRAAVDAAADWGTYVAVHAYTSQAVRRAIAAGVKCIDHGQLVDDATAQLMAERGIWWSLQPLTYDAEVFARMSPASQQKALQVFAGTENAYRMAKEYNIKTVFGADILFDPGAASRQGSYLAMLARWMTPAEALKTATANTGELLALSSFINPYPGKLGIVEEGALADLLLVEGNPLEKLDIVADPDKNFLVIMKDGKIYKNTLTP